MNSLESLILTKLGEHRITPVLATSHLCSCGFLMNNYTPEDLNGHLASVITEAIGLEERLSNLWDDKFGGFVPLYRARGLESDPSEGE